MSTRLAALGLLLVAGALPSCDGGLTPIGDDVETTDLLGVEIRPGRVTVPIGEQVQLRAQGLLDGRDARDVTADATWTSSASDIASVDADGVVTAVAVGAAQVWAEADGFRAPAVRVEVTDAALVQLDVVPDEVTLEAGRTLALEANALFSDGSRADAASQVRWVVGDSDVVTVDDAGLLTAGAVGDTTLHAEWGEITSATVPVTVVESTLPDLRITELEGEVTAGGLRLSATVQNASQVGASDFWVDAFADVSLPPPPGTLGDDFSHVTYLGPGKEIDVVLTIDDLSPGQHQVQVVVDLDELVQEVDESNNVMGATFTVLEEVADVPDLAVTYFDVMAFDGFLFYAVDVENLGTEDVGPFFVDLYLDRTDPPEVGTDGDSFLQLDGVAVGETVMADFLLEDTACPGCTSWVMVDAHDQEDELSEANNLAGPIAVPDP